jgi:tetratricopeptide (TPR) repeat protein
VNSEKVKSNALLAVFPKKPRPTPAQRIGPFSGPFRHMAVVALCWVAVVALAQDPPATPSASPAPALSGEARDAIEKGLADFRANRFEDAKAEFVKLTQLAPNHPVGWVNLGSVEYRLNQLDDAAEHLRKAVRLDLTAAPAWLTLGIICYQKSDLDGALAALSQAVYLEPKNARNHLYLGVVVRKKGWIDAAGDELRKAVELDETYAEAHFNLAVLYLELKPAAIELARRHYLRALALGAAPDPDLDQASRQGRN